MSNWVEDYPDIAKVLAKYTFIDGTSIAIEEWSDHFELISYDSDGEDDQWFSFKSADVPTIVKLFQELAIWKGW